MKLLHTSDWHLGQNFMFRHRTREHECFLSWLHKTIQTQSIDLLIVAGDVFDTATPPNYALKLYYQFLAGLKNTPCQTVIIISGNHDSPAVLNAPSHVLRALNVHVVAAATENIEDEIIWVKNKNREYSCVVCAVPFLREQDLRKSIAGESWEDKNQALIQGIGSHYDRIADKAMALMKTKDIPDLPLIGTGHLFAAGGKIGEDDHIREIHVGNLGRFNLQNISGRFDYIALGHLHKCQKVAEHNHIRYPGSPIPLSFGEAGYSKYVLTVEFQNTRAMVKEIQIPQFQTLVRIKGTVEEVIKTIQGIQPDSESDETWAQVLVSGDWDPMAEDQIKKEADRANLRIFAIKRERTDKALGPGNQTPVEDLNNYSPEAVFKKRLSMEAGLPVDRKTELIQAFNEILALVRQDED